MCRSCRIQEIFWLTSKSMAIDQIPIKKAKIFFKKLKIKKKNPRYQFSHVMSQSSHSSGQPRTELGTYFWVDGMSQSHGWWW